MTTQSEVTKLLERAGAEGAPLVEGERATFLWQGVEPPRLAGDFNGWGWQAGGDTLEEIGRGIWTRSLVLPRDAYVEYIYHQADQRLLDPLNPRIISNGMGALNNFLAMPDAEGTSLAQPQHDVPSGTTTRHVVESDHLVVGGQRAVHLYRPPVDGPVPLLVVFDGNDYLRRAHLTVMVDNLIAQRRIRPLAMALVEHGAQARFIEYNCSEATLAFLLRHVVPLAERHLDLIAPEEIGGYGVLGASMGGLISLYAGLRLPRIFGRVLSQSGSFGFQLAGNPSVIYDLIERGQGPNVKIWMDVGAYEGLLGANRRMHRLLRERGYDVTYREYCGAHNYTSWSNDVWRGLEMMFGL